MSTSEAARYYYCDPYIPGAFPSVDSGDIDPNRPLLYFVDTLRGNLRNSQSRTVLSDGSPIVELGFVAPLIAHDQRLRNIRSMLGNVAGKLRLTQMALDGKADGILSEEDLTDLLAPYADQDDIPPAVVAYTRPGVAAIAIRDFGFEIAGPFNCIPQDRENAIRALGQMPITIFMPVERFLLIDVHHTA